MHANYLKIKKEAFLTPQSIFNDDETFASETRKEDEDCGIVDLPNGTSSHRHFHHRHREIIQIMLHKNQMLRRYLTSLQFTQAHEVGTIMSITKRD